MYENANFNFYVKVYFDMELVLDYSLLTNAMHLLIKLKAVKLVFNMISDSVSFYLQSII